jgi:hypothetical protein
VALRLREDSFVTGFPPGWRFVKIWETATRQDAELLVHAFRAMCKDYLPGGSTGVCELVSLPLPTIERVMELIICRAAASKRILLADVTSREIPHQPVPTPSPSPTSTSAQGGTSRPLRSHLHYNDFGGSRCGITNCYLLA